MSQNVLLEANDLIHGERQEQYGDPRKLFKAWACAATATLQLPLAPQDLAVIMVLLKLCRFSGSGYAHKDSLVDAAGYIGLLGMLCDFKEEE